MTTFRGKRTDIKRFSTTALAAAFFAPSFFAAGSGTFTLDGISDPSNDSYTHQFLFPLVLDNGTPAGSTSLKVGIGSNADGSTGGSSDLFLYFEMPLALKDMTWGTGTHPNYNPADKDVTDGKIANNQNTGSEKIEFQWDGNDVEIKLAQRKDANGGKIDNNQDMLDAIANGTNVGHEIKDDGGGAVIAARTSLDYIMENFPNPQGTLAYWGDMRKNHDEDNGSDIGSNSPTLSSTDEVAGYTTADPTFKDWPFHQSWEVQIAGNFDLDDIPNLLTSSEFFGADFGGNDPKDSNFVLHASPIKAGDKFDVVPDGDPEDFPPTPIPNVIPTPSAFAAGLIGILGLAARRRRG